MRISIKKQGKGVLIAIVSLIGLMLILTAILMISQHSNEITERSNVIAQKNTQEAVMAVVRNIDEYTAKASAVAHKAATLGGDDEDEYRNNLWEYLDGLTGVDGYENVDDKGYFKKDDGTLIRREHAVPDQETDLVVKYRNNNLTTAGFVSSFKETAASESGENGSFIKVAFYAPVFGSEYIDGIVLYYQRPVIEGFYGQSNMSEDADFSVLCMSTGEVIVGQEKIGTTQVIDYLRSKVGDKGPVTQVLRLLERGESGVVTVKVNAEDYIVSVGANRGIMQDLAVVELYRSAQLSSSSVNFINTIVAIFILFTIIVFGVVVYFVVRHFYFKRQLLKMEMFNHKFKCKNRLGFEKEAKSVLTLNKDSYFSVIVVQLRHYKYLLETFGETEVNNLLYHLRNTCNKTMQIEESYGYIDDDKFVLLLHAKDRKALMERLNIVSFLASQYKGANAFAVSLKYGIYEVDTVEDITISQMIDYANEANNSITRATAQNTGMVFNFYDNEIRKIRLINEDMELRMEDALKNNEFQVFYQPKYNLNNKRQDGSEALVRWYDSKTNQYNRPALFMQLFETNGFIVKLDKYVYTKVCEYISYSIAHGRAVYPVSINVSRITAVQPGFIDYYVKVKRKFGISDGQIMIEFTESFAYENYETLGNIVEQLHKNGFKCSIDDFGCGYSSYRILKELPMDEIKLDKFFIEKGDWEDRSNHIMVSIVELAKKLGMKVTQEGVETIEDVKRLENFGCDVIQGYYYSHPLPLSDYITFCANSKQHNIT